MCRTAFTYGIDFKELCSKVIGFIILTSFGYYTTFSQRHQGEALYIINSAGIAYHQDAVLYIIIAKAFLYTLRVMIYSPDGLMRCNNGKIAIVDDMPLLSQWIKKTKSEDLAFFGTPCGNRTHI